MGIKQFVRKVPILRAAAEGYTSLRISLANRRFDNSIDYWQERYVDGGTSGDGSTGRLAQFKANVLNDFVRENNVQSVIDFGCGDGQQLALAGYPAYIGLDVSARAVEMCAQRFPDDTTKSFYVYSPVALFDHAGLFRADMAISLDVLYHVVEDRLFDATLRAIFRAARRFVCIYARDVDEQVQSKHIRFRRFTPWVAKNCPDWKLVKHVPSAFPFDRTNPTETSDAEFFIFSQDPGQT